MRRAIAVTAAVLVASLAACGGSGPSDDELRSVDDIRSSQAEANSKPGEFGEQFELDDGTRVTLTNARVDASNTSQSPTLQVDVRAENPGKDTATTPSAGVVCAGNPNEGEYYSSSTMLMGQPLPAKSYDEGTYDLELPSADGSYQPFAPVCEAPAYIAIRSGTIEIGGDVHEVRIPIDLDLLAELNAGATAAAPAPSSPPSPSPSASAPADSVSSAADVAARLNDGGFECSNLRPDSGAAGVEEAVCTHAGVDMVVAYAESKDAMDQGIAQGRLYGLTDDRIVRGGDLWAVIATTAADVPAIKAALGL